MNISQHPLYRIWVTMRQRCRDVNHPQYKDYGGRGIKVCKRWDTFERFLSDMGPRPPSPPRWTLDRIKNDKDYCPSNCKWSTYEEQANNKSNNVIYQGMTVKQAAAALGVHTNTIYRRAQLENNSLRRGKPPL